MKLVLTENIRGLGSTGDLVEVKDGYARNFLLPRKLAAVPQDDVIKKWRKERESYLVRESGRIDGARAIKERMTDLGNVVITMKANDAGQLFGSVTEAIVAEAVSEAIDVELNAQQIILATHFKRIGEYQAIVRLHSEVEGDVTIVVESEEDPEDRAERLAAEEAARLAAEADEEAEGEEEAAEAVSEGEEPEAAPEEKPEE